MSASPVMSPSHNEDEKLRQAFALFSETSEMLAGTYLELQAQVARLTSELADANGELARQRAPLRAGRDGGPGRPSVAHAPWPPRYLYAGHLARPRIADADRIRFAEKTLSRLRYLERLIQDMLLFVKGARLSEEVFLLSPSCWKNWPRPWNPTRQTQTHRACVSTCPRRRPDAQGRSSGHLRRPHQPPGKRAAGLRCPHGAGQPVRGR
jgi:hypothetical protein